MSECSGRFLVKFEMDKLCNMPTRQNDGRITFKQNKTLNESKIFSTKINCV